MRIAIVNDMPLAVESLRRAIALNPQNEVIWIARNGAEAVDKCAQATPDLVLMDLIMPQMDGVEATRRIMEKTPCAILMVTVSVGANVKRVYEAMGYGALDAIDTPEFGLTNLREHAAPLLSKVESIGKLIARKVGKPAAGGALASPVPATPAPVARKGVPLMVLGASAGGPTALSIVLRGLPPNFAAAVVVVQHVDKNFASGMAEWLGARSSLPVAVAREGDQPLPGRVLLAGTAEHLRLVSPDRLGYSAEPVDLPYRPSVDVFLQSVSELWTGPVAGVLLSGMGTDGAEGLRALRNAGHHTITQDRATSTVFGMQDAAAELGAVMEVLPVNRIAPRLIEVLSPSR